LTVNHFDNWENLLNLLSLRNDLNSKSEHRFWLILVKIGYLFTSIRNLFIGYVSRNV